MIEAWIPFLAAIILIAVTPLSDRQWSRTFRKFLQDVQGGDPDDLESAASWVVDTAQILPGTALTAIGVALIFRHQQGGALAAIVVLVVAVVLAFAYWESTNYADLFAYTVNKKACYSRLQWLQAGLNAIGIIVALSVG